MKQLHPFDEQIRERIAALPETPPRGWDELADRLDAPADAALAGKLAALAPAAVPAAGSWQHLAGKLDALEATASQHPIDATVSSGLEQATPVAVSGWAQLAARLELTGRRREMVACVTVTEAALMLSFLVLLLRFGPDTTGNQGRPTAADFQGTPFPLTLATPPVVEGSAVEIDSPVSVSPVAGITTPARRASKVVPTLSDQRYRAQAGGLRSLPALARGVRAVEVVTPHDYRVEGGDPLASPTFPSAALLSGAPIRYYLNLFVSPFDVNDIFTFENRGIGVLEDRRILSTGSSAGVLLDVSQQKNALQIGVIYGRRSYVPAEILNLEQAPAITNPEDKVRYGRLTYHTVSLPLNYEREIATGEKWRVSGGVGMAMNVILQSEFRLDSDASLDDLDQAIDEFVKTLSKKPPVSGRASARSLSEVRRPNPGYLEGGSLLDNSSLYLSGTLRIERLIGERTSIYIAPTVSRLVTINEFDGGKGPLEDRIHNTMFRFGTRIRLTNK